MKQEGETPLEALERFRQKHKSYQGVKMTYAGRLDPMASGILVVLAGEETKNKEKYLRLNKEYEFEVLFGFATDTYDILGKVTRSNILTNVRTIEGKKNLEKRIKKEMKYFRGKFIQAYPAYSSKTVNGKHLFQYAREGEEVASPVREVEVKKIELLKIRTMGSKHLLANIAKRIKKIRGDFRQKEILEIWRKKLAHDDGKYFLASFRIKCGSGTYVRSISHNLGQQMGIPALAYSIRRTKVGKFGRMSK